MPPAPGKIHRLPVKVLYTIDGSSETYSTILNERQDVFVHPPPPAPTATRQSSNGAPAGAGANGQAVRQVNGHTARSASGAVANGRGVASRQSSVAPVPELAGAQTRREALLGSCALKDVAWGVCFASPECVPAPTYHDFSVYALDPHTLSKPSTSIARAFQPAAASTSASATSNPTSAGAPDSKVWSGKGFLSWSLYEEGPGSTLVRGTVVREVDFEGVQVSGGLEGLMMAEGVDHGGEQDPLAALVAGAGTAGEPGERGIWGLEVHLSLKTVHLGGRNVGDKKEFGEMIARGKDVVGSRSTNGGTGSAGPSPSLPTGPSMLSQSLPAPVPQPMRAGNSAPRRIEPRLLSQPADPALSASSSRVTDFRLENTSTTYPESGSNADTSSREGGIVHQLVPRRPHAPPAHRQQQRSTTPSQPLQNAPPALPLQAYSRSDQPSSATGSTFATNINSSDRATADPTTSTPRFTTASIGSGASRSSLPPSSIPMAQTSSDRGPPRPASTLAPGTTSRPASAHDQRRSSVLTTSSSLMRAPAQSSSAHMPSSAGRTIAAPTPSASASDSESTTKTPTKSVGNAAAVGAGSASKGRGRGSARVTPQSQTKAKQKAGAVGLGKGASTGTAPIPTAKDQRDITPPPPPARSSPPPSTPSRAALHALLRSDSKMSPELARRLASHPALLRLLKAVPAGGNTGAGAGITLESGAGAGKSLRSPFKNADVAGGAVGDGVMQPPAFQDNSPLKGKPSPATSAADFPTPASTAIVTAPTPTAATFQSSTAPTAHGAPASGPASGVAPAPLIGGHVCDHCGACQTTIWRSKTNAAGILVKVCNDCGVYFNKHKRKRPPEMWDHTPTHTPTPPVSTGVQPGVEQNGEMAKKAKLAETHQGVRSSPRRSAAQNSRPGYTNGASSSANSRSNSNIGPADTGVVTRPSSDADESNVAPSAVHAEGVEVSPKRKKKGVPPPPSPRRNTRAAAKEMQGAIGTGDAPIGDTAPGSRCLRDTTSPASKASAATSATLVEPPPPNGTPGGMMVKHSATSGGFDAEAFLAPSTGSGHQGSATAKSIPEGVTGTGSLDDLGLDLDLDLGVFGDPNVDIEALLAQFVAASGPEGGLQGNVGEVSGQTTGGPMLSADHAVGGEEFDLESWLAGAGVQLMPTNGHSGGTAGGGVHGDGQGEGDIGEDDGLDFLNSLMDFDGAAQQQV